MTSIVVSSDVSRRRGLRTPPADFAARIRARQRSLRSSLARRDTLVECVRAVNATVDPHEIAGWVVKQAAGWLPAPCWAVVVRDIDGTLVVLADQGLTPRLSSSLWGAAHWVMRHGADFCSADLANDTRAPRGALGSALALPLFCRTHTIGALVGLDESPSASVPVPSGTVAPLLRSLLEPPAIAIDNALVLQRAEALSVTDDLTRLYNARYLNLALRQETKRTTRTGRPLSLLFIDLDEFKQVNDRYGHLAGGKGLVEAAALIRASARETDVVARFGGDEFSVILPDTGREGAVSVATRILERFRAFRFLAGEGLSVALTVSVGVATFPDAASSAEELLRVADEAMYGAKAAGKNAVRVAQASPADPEGSQ